MASSSDWLAAVQAAPLDRSAKAPAWFGTAAQSGGFAEGLPFARGAAATPDLDDSANPGPIGDAEDVPDPLDIAYAEGEAAGRAAAEAEHSQEIELQRALRLNFRALDTAAMDALAADLAETVIGLCEQTLEGFKADPETLAQRCHAAAERLGSAAKDAALHLHPADIDQLDPMMLKDWRVVPDETIGRSGLRFETPDGSVSDRREDWQRAIVAALSA